MKFQLLICVHRVKIKHISFIVPRMNFYIYGGKKMDLLSQKNEIKMGKHKYAVENSFHLKF